MKLLSAGLLHKNLLRPIQIRIDDIVVMLQIVDKIIFYRVVPFLIPPSQPSRAKHIIDKDPLKILTDVCICLNSFLTKNCKNQLPCSQDPSKKTTEKTYPF